MFSAAAICFLQNFRFKPHRLSFETVTSLVDAGFTDLAVRFVVEDEVRTSVVSQPSLNSPHFGASFAGWGSEFGWAMGFQARAKLAKDDRMGLGGAKICQRLPCYPRLKQWLQTIGFLDVDSSIWVARCQNNLLFVRGRKELPQLLGFLEFPHADHSTLNLEWIWGGRWWLCKPSQSLFLQMMIVQEPASVLGAWFGGDDFCAVRLTENDAGINGLQPQTKIWYTGDWYETDYPLVN